MTTSVQGAFGSQLMVGGFILNNQLTDFDYVPDVPAASRSRTASKAASGRCRAWRRRSCSTSAGRLRLLVGSPGGTRIIGFVAQSDRRRARLGSSTCSKPSRRRTSSPRKGRSSSRKARRSPRTSKRSKALGHSVALSDMNSGLHAIAIDYPRPASTRAVGRRRSAPRGRRARRLALASRGAQCSRGRSRSLLATRQNTSRAAPARAADRRAASLARAAVALVDAQRCRGSSPACRRRRRSCAASCRLPRCASRSTSRTPAHERLEARARDPARGAPRMDAGAEQRLARVDVADADDDAGRSSDAA